MDFNDRATTAITSRDIDYVADADSGQVWILHGKPFAAQKSMKAVEFAAGTGIVTIIADDDTRQAIDIPVKHPVAATFALASSVTVVWTETGDILDMHILPLTVV